jgi:hypothetical protein
MAGKRHHILPRFLLKGFASKTLPRGNKKDAVFVWVYKKDAEPYESNIINVGVEKHFYGKEGELNVDEEMTSLEHDFAISLESLRAQDDGASVSDDRLIEFIVHLTARTKHLRDSIIDASGFLFDNVFGYFSDYNNWRSYLIKYFTKHPEVIKEELEKVLRNVQVSAHKKAMMCQRVKKMPVERIVQLIDEEGSQWELLFQLLRIKFTEDLADIVKQAHIKSLLKNLVSEPRADHYRQLQWYVRKSAEPFILGDVGCLFELAGDTRFKSLGGTEDEILKVYLPISSHCVVVGTALTEAPQVAARILNEAFAKCSREYFVCSARSSEALRLATLLSSQSDMITRDELLETMTDVIFEP